MPRGTPFAPGQSGNPNGRPKGAKDKQPRAIMEFLREVANSVEYQESAKARMLEGKAPHLEVYMLQKVNGKPTERVHVSGEVTTTDKRGLLKHLTDDMVQQLAARAQFEDTDSDEGVTH